MPVDRQPISVSQLSELLGVDPARFIAVENILGKWYVVTEPDMQNTGTMPQLTKGGKKIGGSKKGGSKRGC